MVHTHTPTHARRHARARTRTRTPTAIPTRTRIHSQMQSSCNSISSNLCDEPQWPATHIYGGQARPRTRRIVKTDETPMIAAALDLLRHLHLTEASRQSSVTCIHCIEMSGDACQSPWTATIMAWQGFSARCQGCQRNICVKLFQSFGMAGIKIWSSMLARLTKNRIPGSLAALLYALSCEDRCSEDFRRLLAVLIREQLERFTGLATERQCM